MKKNKQGGVALIVAMLIVAIATMVATQIFYQQQIAIRRTFNQLQSEQLYQLFLSTENWAKVILQDDLTKNKFDYLGDNWAKNIAPFDAENAVIKAKIVDYQACFNINNLAGNNSTQNDAAENNEQANNPGENTAAENNPTQDTSKNKTPKNTPVEILKNLMTQLQLNPELVNPLVDWLDKDDEIISSTGAELETYSRLTPSYRAANFRIIELNELYAIAGWKQETINKLLPYLCALPPVPDFTPMGRYFPNTLATTTINVNTASELLLRSLSPEMANANLTGILEQRKIKGYELVNDFLTQLNKDNPRTPPLGTTLKLDLLSTKSQYFLLEYNGKLDKLEQLYRSLIYRTENKQTDSPDNAATNAAAPNPNNTTQANPANSAKPKPPQISTLYRLQYY
jgi:general secretion pathway protein K